MLAPCFGVLGGDLRQRMLYRSLLERGYDARLYGFGEGMRDLDAFMRESDPILLPLPITTDGEHVYAPFLEGDIPLSYIFENCDEKIVFGGRVSNSVAELAKSNGVTIADYFAREEMTVRNIVPTVEGALQIAMERTEFTIHGSRCLVIGHGRLGRTLANTLHRLGAKVTVSARKASDFAWCAVEGIDSVHNRDLQQALRGQHIVFNTVPYLMLTEELLGCLTPDTLVIDLASAPGGVDFTAAHTLPIQVVQALSLPGKVAPRTAGEIICDTVLNMLEEASGYGG